MPSRSLLLAITWTGFALAASAAETERVEPPWSDVVARATAAEKPIVAFSHFPYCPSGSTCDAFITLAEHPANRRRLAGVVFATRELEEGDEDSSVSVHSPDGTRIIRWAGIPDASQFSLMLTGIDKATPNIVASYRAAADGCTSESSREHALALLALGYELRARPELEALRMTGSDEDRQLATIWLERLLARQEKRLPDEALLRKLTRDGISMRVRFEAWIGVGDVLLANLRGEEAVDAYQKAVQLAADPSPQRQLAHDARERAELFAAPVRGVGPQGSIVTGRRTLWPQLLPTETTRVEYRLDEKVVSVAKKAPFAASVDFGRLPKRRTLEVTARDSHGKLLRTTSVAVNDRVDAFSVDIVEPSATLLAGQTDVVVSVKVPKGRRVLHVVVEWNGARVAKIDAPPWVASLTIRPDEQGVLRAAARLDDGAELEDVLLVNSWTMALESDVQLVEVPVYSNKGASLDRKSIRIREDGKERPVDRVIAASDAPMSIALLIDASWSMTENLLDVQEAAIRFVERHTRPDDRVMVVGFDTQLRILWPTSDRATIERAILSIRAQGYTSLNDALLGALLQLQSPGWRRALVVFSDGLDNASSFTAGDVTDVAKRSGVPIYALSLRPAPPTGVPGLAMRSAHWTFAARTELMKIAWSSGGKAWDLQSLAGLDAIWSEVGDDLARQSLVVYQPAAGAKEWRAIEVFDGKQRLRAPSGLAVAPEVPTDGQ